MSNKTNSQELKQILEVIRQFSAGASMVEVSTALPAIPKRTLQRRLASLVATGEITVVGLGQATRYRMPVILSTPAHTPHPYDYIPLLPASEALRQAISQPLAGRHPVGYYHEFLNTYQPNVSYYLPESLRKKLKELGQVSQQGQPAGTYAKKIFQRLAIDLSWNSSRLEGNTYSLLETERLLQQGELTTGKQRFEAQMILNHKAAIEFMISSAAEIDFNRYTILNLHALLADNLLPNPAAGGRLRQISIGIFGSVYYPLDIPQAIEECFQKILDKAQKILDPFEQAFFFMVHIPYLQPFEDVNKRVSRLAANLPLIRKNLCPLSFIDVPQQAYMDGTLAVYEFNQVLLLRDIFEWAYQRSAVHYAAIQQSLGEPDPFKMQYRDKIAALIKEVVSSRLNKQKAAQLIQQKAGPELPAVDRQKFIEVVERELHSLHEGNIARYQIRLQEYIAWQQVW